MVVLICSMDDFFRFTLFKLEPKTNACLEKCSSFDISVEFCKKIAIY